MEGKPFSGPLFVVGMPRSGTKLLRTVLDQHSQIGMAEFETEFFPYWVKNWDRFGDLSEYCNFEKFYFKMMRIPYFLYCSRVGKVICCSSWYKMCEGYTPAQVFKALVIHDINSRCTNKRIWGDKSPSYLNHMCLLKEHFPQAKFIHIIRDVRDYCLSINNAWGKNMYRAAQRWVDTIRKARQQGRKFGEDYYELRFEDLISQPEKVLINVCSFLNIPFERKMLELDHPTENIGSAKGRIGILSDNKGKYLNTSLPQKIFEIEKIAWPLLIELDYPVRRFSTTSTVPPVKMFLYQIYDGISLLRSTVSRRGIKDTLKLNLGFIKISLLG